MYVLLSAGAGEVARHWYEGTDGLLPLKMANARAAFEKRGQTREQPHNIPKVGNNIGGF